MWRTQGMWGRTHNIAQTTDGNEKQKAAESQESTNGEARHY